MSRFAAIQLSLFEDYKFMDIPFPKPQYLGSKYIHSEWIAKHIPEESNVVLDAFSGSQSVGFLCKKMGKTVISNDFLLFNSKIGKALVENKNVFLDSDDIDILFSPNSDTNRYNLMENLYSNLFFIPEETKFLDSFRSNIDYLQDDYKKALAFSVINRAMTRKVTMGHFAHTQALIYASDPKRIKRNRSLVRPIRDIFLELVEEYNHAVFDNGTDCVAYNENIFDLLPSLSNIDVAYFDPPYCDSHADYQSFYHLLETYTNYWKDKEFVNGIKRYSPKKKSGFDTKTDIINSFNLLFKLSEKIPYWLISYNDRSYPTIDTLIELITPFREVSVEKKTYTSGRGGKGSVAGSNEILIICKP